MRLVNRLLAFLLAAFLLIASVLLVVEVIGYAITAKPVLIHWTTWYSWAGRTEWKAGVVRFWAVVLMIVGLLLLYVELKPRAVSRIAIDSNDQNVDAAITRRGLTALATRAATSVDGVRGASVSATARKITVAADAAARDGATAAGLKAPIGEAVSRSLDALGLAKSPKVTVRVTPREQLMHADKTNRAALTLLGLVLLVVGAGAMTMSVGAFGSSQSKRPLFHNRISTYIGAHGSWIWAAAAVLAALVALVMLRWVVALVLSTDRAADLDVRAGEGARGTGVVRPAAVNQAVVAEIETYRGVESAKARTLGDSDEPILAVTITVDKAENLDSVRKRVEADVVVHVRQALDNPTLPVLLDFAVAKKAPARV